MVLFKMFYNIFLEHKQLGKKISSKEEIKIIKEEILKLKSEINKQENAIKIFAELTPEFAEKLEKNEKSCRDGINRWTDNIYNVQAWV
jgi:hypothetical protein